VEGNWGCGAFLGDREHKSLLQLLAASEAGRPLVYYVFDDKKLANTLTQYASSRAMSPCQTDRLGDRFNAWALSSAGTVGELYAKLVKYAQYVSAASEEAADSGSDVTLAPAIAFVTGATAHDARCVIS